MKNSNTDIVTDQNASEFSQSVTGCEHREYDCKIINMSVDRIFCDTAQEGKTEGELSCVLYLKVPEQISGMVEIPGYGMVDDGTAGESTEGYTNLSWGDISEPSILKPATEQYLRPEAGKMIMFPSWLNYRILPFSGEGESRLLTANISLTEK